jgi:hypothetical protein
MVNTKVPMINFIDERITSNVKRFILDILTELNGSIASIEDLPYFTLPYDEVNEKLNLFYKNEHLGYIKTSFEGNIYNINFFPKMILRFKYISHVPMVAVYIRNNK